MATNGIVQVYVRSVANFKPEIWIPLKDSKSHKGLTIYGEFLSETFDMIKTEGLTSKVLRDLVGEFKVQVELRNIEDCIAEKIQKNWVLIGDLNLDLFPIQLANFQQERIGYNKESIETLLSSGYSWVFFTGVDTLPDLKPAGYTVFWD